MNLKANLIPKTPNNSNNKLLFLQEYREKDTREAWIHGQLVSRNFPPWGADERRSQDISPSTLEVSPTWPNPLCGSSSHYFKVLALLALPLPIVSSASGLEAPLCWSEHLCCPTLWVSLSVLPLTVQPIPCIKFLPLEIAEWCLFVLIAYWLMDGQLKRVQDEPLPKAIPQILESWGFSYLQNLKPSL